MTRRGEAIADLRAKLAARYAILWVVTDAERDAERGIAEAAAGARYEVATWDCRAGLRDLTGEPVGTGPALADPNALLDWIRDNRARRCIVLRDLHRWMDPVVVRALCNLARQLPSQPLREARALVVVSPSSDIPPELRGHTTVVEWPLPDRDEVAAVLEELIAAQPEERRAGIVNGNREAVVDAAVGLSIEGAANAFAESLVRASGLKIDTKQVSAQKRAALARGTGISWFEPDPRGFDAMGGNDLLKAWLEERRQVYSARARAFGLPLPKGVMLVGPPGTGKSMTAKAVAANWGVPLLRLDLGGLKSKFVGDSEANIRRALATAEAAGNVVLWIDEIEKALAGASGPQGDGGVASDALGTLLTWMEDRKGSAFVVATANDVTALQPELLRRFDEMFFVDLPSARDRAAVLASVLRGFARDPARLDLAEVARVTRDFTGAELSKLVPSALFASFNDGARELTTEDLLRAAARVVPLAVTAGEKIKRLREWAKGRCQLAATPESDAAAAPGRELGL